MKLQSILRCFSYGSLWFTKSSVSTAELNLELKPQANNIRIILNLIYDEISPPVD